MLNCNHHISQHQRTTSWKFFIAHRAASSAKGLKSKFLHQRNIGPNVKYCVLSLFIAYRVESFAQTCPAVIANNVSAGTAIGCLLNNSAALEIKSGASISGVHDGIMVGNASSQSGGTSGGILNGGSIKGIYLGLATNNAGLPTAGQSKPNYAIHLLNGSKLNGGITNNGVIWSNSAVLGTNGNYLSSSAILNGSAGIYLGGSAVLNGGIINNQGASISGFNAIIVDGTVSPIPASSINSYALSTGSSIVNGGIYNAGTISTPNSTSSGSAILIDGGSLLNGGITNTSTGIISAYYSSNGIRVGATTFGQILGGITNAGSITGNTMGINIGANSSSILSSIDQITNTGTIYGVTFGVNNIGHLGTLNNLQGAGNPRGALTYNGVLPNNYNIIIANPSNFGRVAFSSPSGGPVNFGISSLSGGASVVSTTPYTQVLTGVSNLNLGLSGTSKTGVSNGYSYTLSQKANLPNTWDLTVTQYVTPAPPPPPIESVANALIANSSQTAKGAANAIANIVSNPSVAMLGVVDALTNMNPTAQAKAVNQMPKHNVDAPKMVVTNVRHGLNQILNQIVQAHQNAVVGLSSGEEAIPERDFWIKGFGSWANQGPIGDMPGYSVNSSGLALGANLGISPGNNVGAFFALANSNVSGGDASASNRILANSYQAGVYGDYAINPRLNWNYQADLGFNSNEESRSLSSFSGVSGVESSLVTGHYNSYSEHLGSGLKQLFHLMSETNFILSARVDYTLMQNQGYVEHGGGALNLIVEGRQYQELLLSSDFRLDHKLSEGLKFSVNMGAGYNALNTQAQINSAFVGGGPSFATASPLISPWVYSAGAGITGRIRSNMDLQIRYDGQYRTSGYTNNMASARLKVYF